MYHDKSLEKRRIPPGPAPIERKAYATESNYRFGVQPVFESWHSVPMLVRRTGALRNGSLFEDFLLPVVPDRVLRHLADSAYGHCRLVEITSDGLVIVYPQSKLPVPMRCATSTSRPSSPLTDEALRRDRRRPALPSGWPSPARHERPDLSRSPPLAASARQPADKRPSIRIMNWSDWQ